MIPTWLEKLKQHRLYKCTDPYIVLNHFKCFLPDNLIIKKKKKKSGEILEAGGRKINLRIA